MKIDENIYKSTVVFLMLFSISEDTAAKIPHKKVIRGIKKYLAGQRNLYGREYVRMVNATSDSLPKIAGKMVLEGERSMMYVSPAKLLYLFYKLDNKLFKLWGITDETLFDYMELYKKDFLLFPSLMYYNRLHQTYVELTA